MHQKGKLTAIWLKRMRLGPMDARQSAKLVANKGLAGNANQSGKRQVTIIDQAVFERLREELSDKITPEMRRANLMVSGITLANSRGKILQIGECRIEIYGETLPCRRMDEAYSGLRNALEPKWNGGAYGVVLNDGEISVGDSVRWIE